MRRDQVVTPKKALEDSALADVHTEEYIKTVRQASQALQFQTADIFYNHQHSLDP